MSMKARDRLLILISVAACGVAIAAFAVVSLGHFISTPGKTPISSATDKMYAVNVQQFKLLDKIPTSPPPTTTNSHPVLEAETTNKQQAKLHHNVKKHSHKD